MITPLWEDIQKWALAEIELARDALEGATQPEAYARGRIAALRELLDMPRRPERTTPTPTRGYSVSGQYFP